MIGSPNLKNFFCVFSNEEDFDLLKCVNQLVDNFNKTAKLFSEKYILDRIIMKQLEIEGVILKCQNQNCKATYFLKVTFSTCLNYEFSVIVTRSKVSHSCKEVGPLIKRFQCGLSDIIHTCLLMNSSGINQGTSGNVSLKFETSDLNDLSLSDEFFAITPTGMDYKVLGPKDLTVMTTEGKESALNFYDENSDFESLAFRRKRPSSEYRFHCDIYKNFPEVKAIVHTHSKNATALACSEEFLGLPPIHYITCLASSSTIPIADYYLYGTEQLSSEICRVLRVSKAKVCFLRNHGVVAVGKTLKEALALVSCVELVSEQYFKILSASFTPKVLGSQEIEEVLSKIDGYGKQNI